MKKIFVLLSLVMAVTLSACGNGKDLTKTDSIMNGNQVAHNTEAEHKGSGKVPESLKKAEKPVYPVGSKVVVKADHMPGMKGATATVSGAYDTTAYAVSYTPTTGGARVTNHKWIIQEEIKDAKESTYPQGAAITITADHMPGMKGADAVVDSAVQTTVYMIDYTPTTGGDKVTNHKWVVESELSAK
ncbi:YdhK family protein [Paenibacillus sp. P46E]|uniref:DUF1541 domain-containing protein n=1 Tax=Paenibacillus sp. P46E TaxID=1349436 RepID=UPI00093A1593|nr:YdhK family protein [Paenibacillus sp. P46E]OKP97594.1 hypothetical protein A3849_14620 [Paenibacillus sp. P46E]